MSTRPTISLAVLARNEEKMLPDCLASAKDIVDEIIFVDDQSSDRTVAVAQRFGATILQSKHQSNFDENKQIAIDACTSEWILLLDADERLSPELQKELKEIVLFDLEEQNKHQQEVTPWKKRLFDRHTHILQQQGSLPLFTQHDPIVAYIFPRRNYFLGRYLRFGGVYPDGVIRFFKKGTAVMEGKTLHQQLKVTGRVGWTEGDLLHMDSPTFEKYIKRWYRYVDYLREEMEEKKIRLSMGTFVSWCILQPVHWFFLTYFVRKGFLDGWQGFVFSFFSSIRFSGAYYLLFRARKHRR